MRIIRFLALIGALSAAPSAALASFCDDLWFSRNAIMDRAGYCFGSRLGKAVFDNSDCSGGKIALSAQDAARVAELRRAEKDARCAVDTSRTSLDLDDLAIRRRLRHQPVVDEFPGGCLGWIDERAPLRAGHDDASPVIGWVEPGDYVSYSHVGVDSLRWAYVTTFGANWKPLKSGGWLRGKDVKRCSQTIP